MKEMHTINLWSYRITLLLYLTIYFGLYAQIFLGGIQIIFALLLFLEWKNFNVKLKKLISYYWLSVLAFSILCWFPKTDLNTFFYIIILVIIPMTIATYFVYVTREIKKHINEL